MKNASAFLSSSFAEEITSLTSCCWETISYNSTERVGDRQHWVVIMGWLESHLTYLARHHSFFSLQFIRNACFCCGSLANRVSHSSRIYSSMFPSEMYRYNCMQTLLRSVYNIQILCTMTIVVKFMLKDKGCFFS